MFARISILLFFIVCTAQSQICEEPFSNITKIKYSTKLRAEPNDDSVILCKVKSGKKLTITCDDAKNDWWFAKTKKCVGFIHGDNLIITQEMSINKNYEIEQLKWRETKLAKAAEAEAALKKKKELEEAEAKKRKVELQKEIQILKEKEAVARRAKATTTTKSYSSISTSSSSSRRTPRRTSRSYYTGPRGGCYYINSNGNKSYVDRSLCGSSSRSSYSSSSYHSGSRGGCYRYSSSGKKVYVARSKCN